MKKYMLARAALLLVTVSTLSGCIWVHDDRGREGEREHHEDRHYGDEGERH
jgi:hypothetical protein